MNELQKNRKSQLAPQSTMQSSSNCFCLEIAPIIPAIQLMDCVVKLLSAH